MSCLSKFFEKNYEELLSVATRYVGDLGGDLLNDLCVLYLEDQEDKMEAMCERGELMPYICRTLAICGFSKTTRFYYKYKKHQEKIADNYPQTLITNEEQVVENPIDIEEGLQKIDVILQELPWFDAEVFRVYHLHNHSLKTLADATQISKSTLYKSIKETKEYLAENAERIGGLYRELHKEDGDQENC